MDAACHHAHIFVKRRVFLAEGTVRLHLPLGKGRQLVAFQVEIDLDLALRIDAAPYAVRVLQTGGGILFVFVTDAGGKFGLAHAYSCCAASRGVKRAIRAGIPPGTRLMYPAGRRK